MASKQKAYDFTTFTYCQFTYSTPIQCRLYCYFLRMFLTRLYINFKFTVLLSRLKKCAVVQTLDFGFSRNIHFGIFQSQQVVFTKLMSIFLHVLSLNPSVCLYICLYAVSGEEKTIQTNVCVNLIRIDARHKGLRNVEKQPPFKPRTQT